jgi:hypothetical protein
MSGFCPEGCIPTPEAVARATEYWFRERVAALEKAAAPQLETKRVDSLEAGARDFASAAVSDALGHEFRDIVAQTVHRLRSFLHQGELTAGYFGDYGRGSLSGDFWATERADGVLESGIYWPFGKPARWYERRPNYSLFLLESELNALLQPTEKRQFPSAKMPMLVAALRKLDNLPNRKIQLEALCNMPEFREYAITDALIRVAARGAGPRRAGRKSRRQSWWNPRRRISTVAIANISYRHRVGHNSAIRIRVASKCPQNILQPELAHRPARRTHPLRSLNSAKLKRSAGRCCTGRGRKAGAPSSTESA